MSLPGRPERWTVICCPVSGNKTAVATLQKDFFPRAKELGLNVDLVLTERAGHATELARAAAEKGYGIVLVGGDGTLHEGMDGMLAAGLLDKTRIAVLSQGTLNAFFHSAQLPNAAQLPDALSAGKVRAQPLMRVKSSSGAVDTRCFEAVYFGIGYKPAKGAQQWRNSFGGPMAGLMLALVKACAVPSSAACTGRLRFVPKDGSGPVELSDSFFWIIVSNRSPYNGCLTPDELWVSWMTLDETPGFGRLMDAFKPPMEFQSGTVRLMGHHVSVSEVRFTQDDGKLGVCLDGDAFDCGNWLDIKLEPHGWHIVADEEFPHRVPDALTRANPPTPEALRWLAENPPPEGVYCAPVAPTATKSTGGGALRALLAGLVLAGGAAIAYQLVMMSK